MSRALTEPTYQGRAFRYSLPNGWSFRMAFSADGNRLRMEGLTGEYAGQALDLEIAASRVSYGIYFLNWVKPDGGVVSQVHDYNTNTVHAFWAQEGNGTPTGVTTTGSLAPEPPVAGQ
jgi:phenolic acid decarboxylase